jgi:DNA repair protein RadD
MPPRLRHFQNELDTDIDAAWRDGARDVMAVSPCGSGKTVVLSHKMTQEPGASAAIAHRQELVGQVSCALARNGVRHRILGARKGSPLTRIITALHVMELGYSFIDPTGKSAVGGVDTVIKMKNDPFLMQVRLKVFDEGHHVLKENKWGRVHAMMPNAHGLLTTASPSRADGKGLGRAYDGVVDALVLAPSMRDLIDWGYLTDYRYYGPPCTSLDLSNVEVSKTTGDLNERQNKAAIHKSQIVGDVVTHYLNIAPGKLGVTFCVDIEEAKKTAEAFRAAKVPVELVTSDTPDDIRARIIQKFRKREVLQLVNVDLFGEGFDLPALEVVSFARPTASFPLYLQQWNRVLRLMIANELQGIWDDLGIDGRKRAIAESGKPYGIIIDHVGNLLRHNGPPDKRINWTLERRASKRKNDDEIPLTICVQCYQYYERIYKACPYCEYKPIAPGPAGMTRNIEFVDGDLTELDPVFLAGLRGEIARKEGDFHAPAGLETGPALAARRKWMERQVQQRDLRNAIAWWAGFQAMRGHNESETYRRFYFRFGTDIANAQLLGAADAEELAIKISHELRAHGIDSTVDALTYFTSKEV